MSSTFILSIFLQNLSNACTNLNFISTNKNVIRELSIIGNVLWIVWSFLVLSETQLIISISWSGVNIVINSYRLWHSNYFYRQNNNKKAHNNKNKNKNKNKMKNNKDEIEIENNNGGTINLLD